MERPSSKRLGEAAWWFDAAERDLAMARALRREGFYEGTAFHCQQAAEKFLKGLLAAKRRQWHRTHSCVELLELMPELGLQHPE
ncbi:MAG: HEPN domain-containing protein, partial [Firmicutes bacterium]|nr:HEPN domain-containing protein [Bacillota bacterium]